MKMPPNFVFSGRGKAFVFFTAIFFFLFSAFSFSQLHGTYTIGESGIYPTFTAAVSALHSQGVSGPVTFYVMSGTYNEQFVLGKIPGAGKNAAIIFQSATGDSSDVVVQSAAATNNDNYVIKLDSASYVTFRSITFRSTNDQYAGVVVLEGVTDHVTFSHCAFNGSYYPYDNTYRTLVYSTKRIKSLTLENNDFSQGSYGIFFEGAWNDTIRTEIRNNKFDSLGYVAIYVSAADAPVISRNEISHGDNGIMLNHSKGSANISNNNIDVNLIGIKLSYFNSIDGKDALIANNMIALNRADVTNPGNGGIYLGGSDHIKVYYNTSVVYYHYYNDSKAINIQNCDGNSIELVNNNLVTIHDDGYALYLYQTGDLARCDYNNYLTPGPEFVSWNGTECNDLVALQNVNGDNAHSVSADPLFFSDTDLHVNSPELDSAGVPVDGITTDIDGDLRDPQYPDIGADEFGTPPPVLTGDFELANIPLDQLSLGTGLWSDIDTDGDMDVLLGGVPETNEYEVKIYYNNGDGDLISGNVIANIFPEQFDAAAWGDFDNDGDPDLIITGKKKVGVVQSPVTKLFQVDNGLFTEMVTDIISVNSGSVDWGDYDHDGDLDLLIGGNETKIYRNDGSGGYHNWVFTDVKTLPGSGSGSAKWGDYDCDGNLDIFISPAPLIHEVWLYKNTGDGNFMEVNTGITNVNGRSVWFDYDMDGFPDITIVGDSSDNSVITKIYRNYLDGNRRRFIDIQAGLTGLYGGSLSWCDYDLDGDPDLLITGRDSTGETQTRLYDNMGDNHFEESENHFPNVTGSGSWGDLNNDGKPDLLLMGYHSDPDPERSGNITSVYINKTDSSIIPPEPLESLYCTLLDTTVWLEWLSDDEQEGLTYNVRIGTTPAGSEIMSAMANYSTGSLYVPKTGNAGSNRAVIITDLQPGRTYYWSVQTVTPSFTASSFAAQDTFILSGPYFTEKTIIVPGISYGDIDWCDYDSDGDLDLAITGESWVDENITRIYRNDHNAFTEINAGLQGVINSNLSWGDYDNDGDLDLALFGRIINTNQFIGKIYRNDGNDVFNDIQATLINVEHGDAAWGDCDNDGDMDIVITGKYTGGIAVSKIFLNENGNFQLDIDAGLDAVFNSSVAWSDYDKDGDLDLLLAGLTTEGDRITKVYKNNSGDFTEVENIQLPGISSGSVVWGDYDSDGYPDILLTGSVTYQSAYKPVSKIFHNDQHGNFSDINATLDSLYHKKAFWGDIDNDGDLDVILGGTMSSIYINNNGQFEKVNRYIPNLSYVSMAMGDYDNDGGLDFILSGVETDNFLHHVCKLYHNKNLNPNNTPEAPDGLYANNFDTLSVFHWNYGNDEETLRDGLSYNLRVGTTPGGSEVMSSMSDHATGMHNIPGAGNACQDNYWKISGMEYGVTYYWSVQTVDNGYKASEFAPEQSFSLLHYYNVSGFVNRLGYGSIDYGRVEAFTINEQNEPTLVSTKTLNGTNSFAFTGIREGNITLKVIPNTSYYPQYFPLYLGNTPVYDDADKLFLEKDTAGIKITFPILLDIPGGSGSVSGEFVFIDSIMGPKTVSISKRKSPETGEPVPDVWVYLFNSEGDVFSWDVTDDSGSFNFDSIPLGHYSFYADYKGWPMDATNDSLIIDQENHSYEISAVAMDTTISLTISDVTAVQNQQFIKGIKLFPNPVGDNLYLKFNGVTGAGVTIRIIGMNGRIYKILRLGGQQAGAVLRITVSGLTPGVYILSVKSDKINYKTRVIKMK